jgi:hypothetical protein
VAVPEVQCEDDDQPNDAAADGRQNSNIQQRNATQRNQPRTRQKQAKEAHNSSSTAADQTIGPDLPTRSEMVQNSNVNVDEGNPERVMGRDGCRL